MTKKIANRVVKEVNKKIKLLDKDSVDFVIYCRKSTEAEDRQAQSIADQIKTCLRYADSVGLKIMEKPPYFEKLFYTNEDKTREEREKDESTKELNKNTKNLFIIRESSSGKVAFGRKKWRELIKLINAGKIKGVLAYSPDRVSRNMAEGGEFIDLIDNNKVFPQFTNFHYENNDSGKMMLGIYFALSKQYSDKLSLDINRGNKSTLEKGKSLGIHKAGYMIDEVTGQYKPHPEYFPIIRKAFEKKIYENWTDGKIIDYINGSGYKRIIKKTGREVKMNKSHIYEMWVDEFYYGFNVVGGYVINLTELNTEYEPMISEAEFSILYNRYKGNKKNTTKLQKGQVAIKSENYELMVIENGFMKNEYGKGFTFGIPSKGRYLKKIEAEKLKGNNYKLEDIVQDHQMEYSCSDKENNCYNSIKVSDFNKGVLAALKSFKISEEDYQNYVDFLNNEIDKIKELNQNEIARINLAINRLRGEKNELMRINLTKRLDKEEEKVYQDEINRIKREIEIQQESINELDDGEEHKMLEFELFLKVLTNTKNYYKNANIVLKRKMLKILFSNITFTSKKELMFHINSPFEKNFTSFGGANEIRTRVLRGYLHTSTIIVYFNKILKSRINKKFQKIIQSINIFYYQD